MNTKFKFDFIKTPFDWFRFGLLFLRVRHMKINALWEANLDKYFYETKYADLLSYDDTKDRDTLAKEHRKPLDQQNLKLIEDLEIKISQAKAVKAGYRKNEEFRQEVITYIDALATFDVWK